MVYVRVNNFALRPFRALAAAARGRGLGVIHAQRPVDRSRTHHHAPSLPFVNPLLVSKRYLTFFLGKPLSWTLTKNWASAHARPSTKSRLHSVSGPGSATLTRFVQLLSVSAAHAAYQPARTHVLSTNAPMQASTHARTHARTNASMHTHTHTCITVARLRLPTSPTSPPTLMRSRPHTYHSAGDSFPSVTTLRLVRKHAHCVGYS
jgi:hypothetical protein